MELFWEKLHQTTDQQLFWNISEQALTTSKILAISLVAVFVMFLVGIKKKDSIILYFRKQIELSSKLASSDRLGAPNIHERSSVSEQNDAS